MWTLIGTAYIFYALYNYLARACFRNADKLTTELHTKYKLLYIGLSTHMDQNYGLQTDFTMDTDAQVHRNPASSFAGITCGSMNDRCDLKITH